MGGFAAQPSPCETDPRRPAPRRRRWASSYPTSYATAVLRYVLPEQGSYAA